MAAEAVTPESEVAVATWRGIDELAELVGAYCWVENRIFELSGAWASEPGGRAATGLRAGPAGLVRRRRPGATGCWRPAGPSGSRCGPASTAAALVTAPAGPLAGALDALAAAARRPGRCGGTGRWRCSRACRPSTAPTCARRRRSARAPVLEVLTGAHRDLAGEISGGRSLLEASAAGLTRDAAPGPAIRTGV